MAVATAAATEQTAALEVRDLRVTYGGVVAVEDVSFDVPSGTILGLIGPNGAGKTTVFDAISGFARVERGRILLAGREIGRAPSAQRARLGLGRSFQDGRLFPSLTVFETLACAFERHQRSQGPVSSALSMPWVRRAERRVHERVDELIDFMGLEAFRDKFLSELSTGSRRIVDLGCVLAHEPTVLLLDEPSSGIAQKETEALGPLLLRVKESTGCTMLLIEHDMPLITSVSDELIALETGRVIARGTPREVTNDRLVVEAYLGTDERIIARSGAADADGSRNKTRPRRATPSRARKTAGKGDRKVAAKRVSAKKRKTKGTAAAGEAKKTVVKKSAGSKGTPKPSAGSSRRTSSKGGSKEVRKRRRSQG